MLDKMLSVSPPLKGKAPDSKVDKDFRNTSADSKAEFEKTLQEKLDLKESEKNKQKQEVKDGDSKANEKAKQARSEESGSRAEKKDKKSSGGIKKKMTDEEDNKMVSNGMVSIESEVEIPESKTDLAEIEVGIVNQESKSLETLMSELRTTLSEEQSGETVVDSFDMDAAVQPKTELVPPEIAKMNEVQPQMPQAQMPQEQMPAEKVQAAQVMMAQQSSAQLEKELGDEVGFQSEIKQQASSELVQKMKAFEIEKNLAPDKAQAFELAVLDQLKKQMSSDGQQSSGQSDTKDGSHETLKDLKTDFTKSDGLNHAGQSHTDFKANLAGAVDKTSDVQSSKLEESYDKNIKEIMSQGKYLVTKGGGEMKISMSPEGMGEVQLRVILQDGKVNVEIQTQDKAVKKMIEDSLTELKSGLAAHRLSVEHVRIDTVTATNTDNSAQSQTNLNQGGSEGKQREFWNSFQQNLGQQNSGKSSYQGSSAAGASAVDTRATNASTSSALRTYGGTKGATVNRVA
ncbi:MAG: flagellar hook-length control protein FliK [Bdellovibrio sp.]|nr:flagellar hook-length control protein FliK [Bdellovibrio sp.]